MTIQVWSGGQTGADRGALDAAIALGVPHAGWCPRGRRAEDGRIPDRYRIREHASPAYQARTAANVRDTNATLIASPMPLTGGTRLTAQIVERYSRPLMVVDVRALSESTPTEIVAWLRSCRVSRLNVAGPRESKAPGIAAVAEGLLVAVLERLAEGRA